MEAYIDGMNSIAETVPDPTAAREQRAQVWGRIIQLVGQGVSTGSRTLDRLILQGRDTVEFADHINHVPHVPTPAEHFQRQDPGASGTVFRPNLMVFMSGQDFSLRILDALVELGRNALAGRSVLRDHPINMSPEYHNVTTNYVTVTVLNLSNIERIPWFASNKGFPSEIRKDKEEMRKRLVLPHLVVNNPGHIITLCESFDFSIFIELCIEYNVIAVQCSSDKNHSSPPISIFVKSPYGMVEVIYHWDGSKEPSSKTDGWLVHGVLARCVFGPKTHDIDEGTRERTEHRYTGEPTTTYAIADERRHCTHMESKKLLLQAIH